MKKNASSSIKARLKSFSYAFKGFKHLVINEPNFKIHLVAAGLVFSAGFYFQIQVIEWALLGICIVAVLSAEAFNTALELLCDEISPEQNPTIGKIKDMSAFAVLIVSLVALAIGCLLFIPYLSDAFSQNFS